MVYSGWEIFDKLNKFPATTQSLDAAEVASHKLKVIHEQLGQVLTTSQNDLNSFWKGKGADNAAAGLAPLIQTSEIASQNMDNARKSMLDQNASFHKTRGAVVPVPNEKPGDDGPLDIVSIGASNDEIAAAQFETDTRHNVEVYESYYQSTQPRSTQLAPTYPAAHDPSVDVGGVTPDPIDPGTPGPHSIDGKHGSGGGSDGTRAAGFGGGPSSYTPPPGAANYQIPPPPVSSPVPDPRPPLMSPPGFRPPPAGGTDPSRWNPPVNPPGSRPPGGLGPGGGGGTSGGFGPLGGGGFGPVGGGGFGGGGGLGGGKMAGGAGGAGAGSGSGGLSGGRGSGVGIPGEGGMRGGSAIGGGAAGKAGSMGSGGMGGMGGGKGQGAEDEEHQRKILLPEEDPDSIFGGFEDGQKPTPPVIGA